MKRNKNNPNSLMNQLTEDSPFLIFLRSLTVGGIAAASGKTICAPIERIKILLQIQANHPDLSQSEKFKGFWDCAKEIWKRQPSNRKFYVKPIVYWRGNYVNVLRYFPLQAISFACKTSFRNILMKPNVEYSAWGTSWRSILAGSMAGLAGTSVMYPLDMARTLLTSDINVQRQHKGLCSVMKYSYRTGGFKYLYRGYVANAVGIIPYRGLYFGCYDIAKKYLFDNHPEDYSIGTRWMVSQSIAIFSQTVSYPLDTVKRRLQMTTAGTYKGTWDCFSKIVKEEGILPLYNGCSSNVVRATGCALVLVFYDSIGKFLFLDKDFGEN